MKRGLRCGVLLLAVTPLFAGTAGAVEPIHSVISRDLVSVEQVGSPAVDPTCPWSTASPGITPPSPESRVTEKYVLDTAEGQETVYVGECVIQSSGHGGAGFNGGTWTLARQDGTVSGTVTGGEESQLARGAVLRFTLVATSGTGSLENATGTLYLWGCNGTGGLRLAPKKHWGC